jgi:hypothetical protein
MRWARGRGRLVRVAAVAVGAVALSGGIAYATIPGTSGTISACYEKNTGYLRVIDAEAGRACAKVETPLSWNQRGPAGARGADGAPGKDGEPGARGPSNAYSAARDTVGTDGRIGTSVTTLTSLDLPAGAFTFAAKVGVMNVSTSAPGGVGCELRVATAQGSAAIDRGAAVLAGSTVTNVWLSSTLALAGTGQIAAPGKARLDCWGIGEGRVEAVQLVATQVAALTATP